MKTGTERLIGAILQRDFIAHFAMRKGVLAHKIERIAVRQLDCPQLRQLLVCMMKFEFRCHHRFHLLIVSKPHDLVKK